MGKIVLKIPRKKKDVNVFRDSDKIKSIVGNRASTPVEENDDNLTQEDIELLMSQNKHPVDNDEEKIEEEDIKQEDEEIDLTPEVEDIEESEEASQKYKEKPTYSEIFTISDSNQPIEISLKNLREESIAIEELKQEVQDAYDRGFTDGQETARPPLETEIIKLQNWLKNIDKLTRHLKIDYVQQLGELEETIIPLSIKIAEKIAGYEIAKNADFIVKRVRNTMKQLEGEKLMEITANPEDIEILRHVGSRLLDDPELSRSIKLIPDTNISKGGCKLTTTAGMIDATIKTQMDEIQRELEANMPKRVMSGEANEIIAQSAIEHDEEEDFDVMDDLL